MSLTPVAYSDKVTGVIAIGNSYFYTNRTKLKKNFSHVGILNRNNFRLKDFQRNRSFLKRKSMEADVITYAGISQYPYPTLLKQPLSSFTLQAMLKGRIPKDSIWIKNQFENEIKQSEINIRKGQYLQGYNGIKRTRIKYHWFFDTSYLRDREKQIRKIKGYKQEKRSQVKYRNLESYYKQIYPFMIEEDIAGKQYENLGWWQYQISELDTMAAKNDTYAKEMVSRTKSYLKNRIQFKIDKLSKKKKDFEKRMFLNIFSTIIDRKDYTSYQNIISLSTQDLDYKTSLFYLEKLLENGFKDIDALYNIEGTLPLRITKEYNELIKKHLGRSRYFSSE